MTRTTPVAVCVVHFFCVRGMMGDLVFARACMRSLPRTKVHAGCLLSPRGSPRVSTLDHVHLHRPCESRDRRDRCKTRSVAEETARSTCTCRQLTTRGGSRSSAVAARCRAVARSGPCRRPQGAPCCPRLPRAGLVQRRHGGRGVVSNGRGGFAPETRC